MPHNLPLQEVLSPRSQLLCSEVYCCGYIKVMLPRSCLEIMTERTAEMLGQVLPRRHGTSPISHCGVRIPRLSCRTLLDDTVVTYKAQYTRMFLYKHLFLLFRCQNACGLAGLLAYTAYASFLSHQYFTC